MKAIVISPGREQAAPLLEALDSWGFEPDWADPDAGCRGVGTSDVPVLVLLQETPWSPPAEELLARLPSPALHGRVRVLVLPRRASPARMRRLLELGAQDCLPADAGPGDLELRVAAAARVLSRAAEVLSRDDIMHRLEEELQRPAPVGVLLANVNRLESPGCWTGERILAAAGSAVKGWLRPADLVGRFGNEEFLLVLPGCGADDTRGVAERVRARVPGIQVPGAGPLGISVGLSWHRGVGPAHALRHVAAADAALGRARRSGWNLVSEAPRPDLPPPAPPPGSRVVVIDDEPGVRVLCARALGDVAEVRSFASLEGARPHLEGADVVVTDLQMPQADGREVVEHVRGRGLAARVLVITGCDPAAPELRGIAAAGVPVLLKPFAVPDLQAQVRGLLLAGRPEKSDAPGAAGASEED